MALISRATLGQDPNDLRLNCFATVLPPLADPSNRTYTTVNHPVPAPLCATLSNEPVFDGTVLGAMFGDDAPVIASVLQTFLASTRSSLNELAQAAGMQDLATVGSLAHKIAGASRLSGAMALGQAARDVEQGAKQGHVALVTQRLADLDTQWRLLESALGAKIPSQIRR